MSQAQKSKKAQESKEPKERKSKRASTSSSTSKSKGSKESKESPLQHQCTLDQAFKMVIGSKGASKSKTKKKSPADGKLAEDLPAVFPTRKEIEIRQMQSIQQDSNNNNTSQSHSNDNNDDDDDGIPLSDPFARCMMTSRGARHGLQDLQNQTDQKDAKSQDQAYPADSKSELFVDKYRPRILSELAGQDEAKKEICRWLESRLDDPLIGQQVLLLSGGSGTGKDEMARLAYEKYGLSLVELNGSDQSSSTGAGIDLQTVYQYARHLTNIEGKRIGLLLVDIDGWSNFSMADFVKCLVLHKSNIIQRVKKHRQKKKDAKKELIKQQQERIVVDSADGKAPAAKKRKRATAAQRPPREIAPLEYGLPKAYSSPMVCPIICTTSCSPGGHKKLKALVAGKRCNHVRLAPLSEDQLLDIMARVCAGENATIPRELQQSMVRVANGDARKLLHFLNLALVRDTDSFSSKGAPQQVASYDYYPDVWREAELLLRPYSKISMDRALYAASYLDLLPEMLFQNYLAASKSLESARRVGELHSASDVMANALADDISAQIHYGPSGDLLHSLSCWGTSISLDQGLRGRLAFPTVLGNMSKAKGNRALRYELFASVSPALASLSHLEQMETAHLLMSKIGSKYLKRARAADEKSQEETKETDDADEVAMPRTLWNYQFETQEQVERLEKFASATQFAARLNGQVWASTKT